MITGEKVIYNWYGETFQINFIAAMFLIFVDHIMIKQHLQEIVISDQGAGTIEVYGARVHNLQNIDISIPKNKLVVITGISGSGKSSLAFDTIYSEGQRRYMES